MGEHNLVFQAGAEACATLRRDGFNAAQIGTFAGASGGAKWLVLSQIDRVIASTLLPKLTGPVHLIGSSIGAWRFACYAQRDPLAAIERLEAAYVDQSYSDQPDIDEITAKSREILGVLLGEQGVSEILAHPTLRTHLMVNRARHLAASESKTLLVPGLFAAALLNAVWRGSLGWFFERVLFYDQRDPPPFLGLRGFPLQEVPLTTANLADAIVATGSIPMVLKGVANIDGARPGIYRDGGVIDYHLDFPHSEPGRICLFPHFFGHVKPGWFDKRLPWRHASGETMQRTLLISPSEAFVARLPGSKIPDRRDFLNFTPAERVRRWRETIAMCEALADEFSEVLASDRLVERLQPY